MSTDQLVTLTEFQARLEWTLDQGEQNLANATLWDLSDDARYYGNGNWSAINVPRQVKSLIARAAARFLRNPDGYMQSRAGDEAVHWPDAGDAAGVAVFTKTEQVMLRVIAGRRRQLSSAPLAAYSPQRLRGPRYVDPSSPGLLSNAGYVPAGPQDYATTQDEFPMYAESEGWW